MKCKVCGSEWTTRDDISVSMKQCPFCNAVLINEPSANTAGAALKWIVEKEGVEVFQDAERVIAFLSDLAVDDVKGRDKIGLALMSGAGKRFYKLVSSKEKPDIYDINEFGNELAESGFSEKFIDYILICFLASVGLSRLISERTAPDKAEAPAGKKKMYPQFREEDLSELRDSDNIGTETKDDKDQDIYAEALVKMLRENKNRKQFMKDVDSKGGSSSEPQESLTQTEREKLYLTAAAAFIRGNISPSDLAEDKLSVNGSAEMTECCGMKRAGMHFQQTDPHLFDKKLEKWKQYGHLVAMSNITPTYSLEYFWMLTDQGVVIAAPIDANLKHKSPRKRLFSHPFSFASNGILVTNSNEKGMLYSDFMKYKPNTLVIDNSVEEVNFDRLGGDASWVKKLILPPLISFVPNDEKVQQRFKRFENDMELEFSDNLRGYYFIKNNVIYRMGDRKAVYRF